MSTPASPVVLRHHIKPPANYNPDDKAVRWKLWRSLFENYMTASNYGRLPHEEKKAVLLSHLHPRAFEIFSTLALATGADSYVVAVDALETYFGEKHSKTFSIYNFRRLKQEPGQDLQNFMTSLRSAAVECQFGGQLDTELKQQLISGVSDPRICQELLMLPDSATLEACITKAKTLESSVTEQGGITGAYDKGTFAVRQGGYSQGGKFRGRSTQGASGGTKGSCMYCGRQQVHACKEDCPAWNKWCNKCGRLNHFASVCKAAATGAPGGTKQPRLRGLGQFRMSSG